MGKSGLLSGLVFTYYFLQKELYTLNVVLKTLVKGNALDKKYVKEY